MNLHIYIYLVWNMLSLCLTDPGMCGYTFIDDIVLFRCIHINTRSSISMMKSRNG